MNSVPISILFLCYRPEINIKGWEGLKKDLAGGNNRVSWMDRLPFAFWKGNTIMGDRVKLLQCNSTDQWKAQIATQVVININPKINYHN